jgi:GT2 family glycosyltransferase
MHDPTPSVEPAAAPDVSIVVVNWNTRDLLLALLAKLQPPADARLGIEVIVVDNDSSDDSVARCREHFPGVVLLPQPRNGGFAYGVNRGIEKARGRYVLLLNTDADLQWQALQDFVAEADTLPDGGIFGPRITDEHGQTQASTWNAARPLDHLLDAFGGNRLRWRPAQQQRASVDCVSGCVFLIRRELLQQVGGLDERFFMYFEEADLCARARAAGRRVYYLPSASFVHHGGLSARQAARRTFLAFRESCLLYHVAWHGRLRSEGIRVSMLLGCLVRLAFWLPPALLRRRNSAALYWAACRFLLRPGLVGELARRPRRVLQVTPPG